MASRREVSALKQISKFEEARRASCMSSEQAASIIEAANSTYAVREDRPGSFRLCELKALYDAMSDTGKRLLKEAVDDIFLD